MNQGICKTCGKRYQFYCLTCPSVPEDGSRREERREYQPWHHGRGSGAISTSSSHAGPDRDGESANLTAARGWASVPLATDEQRKVQAYMVKTLLEDEERRVRPFMYYTRKVVGGAFMVFMVLLVWVLLIILRIVIFAPARYPG